MNEMVLMQTALTEVKNPETLATAPVRLLLDSGSHRSYISERLAWELNLKSDGEQDIHVVTFGSMASKRNTTKFTKLDVKLKNGKQIQITINIVPVISGELQRRPLKDLSSDSVKDIVSSVKLADVIPRENETSPIELLIGNDYYLDFIHGEKIEIQPGLYLLASKLGWVLSGRTTDTKDDISESSMLVITYGSNINKSNAFTSVDASIPPKTELEDFWNMESIGIVDKPTSTDDEIAMEKFHDTLEYKDNRYQVTWPWKEDKPDLPTNKELALGRLNTLVNRMKHRPELLQKYDQVMRDQLQKGMIEKVNDIQSDGIVHYIPHHPVITPEKTTTKLRVVYDASAKMNKEKKSLNECLYRGPVMLHDLCGMLIRFRIHPIAMVADIEKAFLQISIQRNQRNVTRFFWLKDIDNPTMSRANIQEYRFCRVPFGVISSPFLLGATIEHHLDSYNSDVADKIKNDIYVDNLITGVDSVSEAKALYTEAKAMFNEGSMNLRAWISNNDEVNATFTTADKAEVKSLKVVGHKWNIADDTIFLKTTITNSSVQHMTKRIILKRIASIFDPMGLICPVMLPVKVFLQNLWSKNLDWDERLCDKDQKMWATATTDLENLSQCCVSRCITRQNQTDVEYRLLCFSDASEKAYAAVIYLNEMSGQRSTTNLVFAKSRLTPLTKMTIPRLELLAVIIGLRCLKFVREQIKLPVYQSYLWTDSQCVLHWINSKKPLSVFVKNRVKEINDSTGISISCVPSKENPADIASRGTSTVKLLNC